VGSYEIFLKVAEMREVFKTLNFHDFYLQKVTEMWEVMKCFLKSCWNEGSFKDF
jgi:hypothetical protein